MIMKKLLPPILVCIAAVTTVAARPPVLSLSKPNVVLIMTDDQGYSDVGFNGNPIIQTPILDKFASNATVFDRFYACPVCSPTRGSLMTGKYALRTGIIDTQEGMSILRPSEITVAEVLQKAGYRTGMFGKWHLGDNAPARPVDQGFDKYLTHVGGMIGAPYSPLGANSYFDPILIENGVEKQFEGYCVDNFTDAAVDFIRSSGNDPFFVYLAPNTPHHPLTVEERYSESYLNAGLSVETSRYYGMITNIDDNFGKVLKVLDEVGEADNTLIIFLGDNGTSSLHKQDDLWECGLRGRKTYVYENGIRVPMFIKLPGQHKRGIRLDDRASVEDIMPTILDACGLSTSAQMDGLSLVPVVKDNSASLPERSFYYQFHRGLLPDKYRNICVVSGSYKLVQAVGRGIEPFSLDTMRFELYDLDKDPLEKEDISAKHPEIVAKMRADYDAWFEDVCSSGFEQVPTWIGAERQGKIQISRQDWRGGGLFDGAVGKYEIDVRTAGTYRITCRWSELLKAAHPVTLKIGDQVLHNEILYAESQCRFDEVYLPKGPCQLEAWVEIDGEKNGFLFIEVEKVSEEKAFATANGGQWKQILSDSCTGDWKEQWFLDGEIGKVTSGPNGMEMTAGPEYENDAHHMVLWTKEEFEGDLKIEYEYIRLDEETRCVNILYIQATGSGEEPYVKDITEWNELRRVPAMSMYFDHMNTYHLSYAAFPNNEDTTSYIRARRYMPNKTGLKGSNLEPDYFPEGLFKTGVPHKITVIKKDRDIFMRVENAEEVYYCHMSNPDLPAIKEGRVGLRHMFTRSARYKNIRISTR
jgi:arylsulfatase A-like enzyme